MRGKCTLLALSIFGALHSLGAFSTFPPFVVTTTAAGRVGPGEAPPITRTAAYQALNSGGGLNKIRQTKHARGLSSLFRSRRRAIFRDQTSPAGSRGQLHRSFGRRGANGERGGMAPLWVSRICEAVADCGEGACTCNGGDEVVKSAKGARAEISKVFETKSHFGRLGRSDFHKRGPPKNVAPAAQGVSAKKRPGP